MHLKIFSAKLRPFCQDGDELIENIPTDHFTDDAHLVHTTCSRDAFRSITNNHEIWTTAIVISDRNYFSCEYKATALYKRYKF